MARKYRKIKQTALRPILSEVLPYELPLPFDNNGMYEFLHGISLKRVPLNQNKFRLVYRKSADSQQVRDWLALLISSANGVETKDVGYRLQGNEVVVLLSGRDFWEDRLQRYSYPLKYLIHKNSGSSRELTYMHPLAMLDSAQFLFDHWGTVQYYCQRSRYSLRHPHRLARSTYRRDTAFAQDHEEATTPTEQDGREYEHASSFFTYSRYNNIYRFYSSSEFLACERKYSVLIKTDVTRCFDSLYTHSVSWVTNGWSSSKRYTPNLGSTFGNQFDDLMQAINFRETNGIIIGPELSRIFAEIILQEVDIRLERDLGEANLRYQADYDVLRYVDDYFIFARDQEMANMIREHLERHLLFFKMHLNESKTDIQLTPLHSEMSIVKDRIERDLRELVFTEQLQDDTVRIAPLSAKRGIMHLKAALSGTQISIPDVANFYLYKLEQRTRSACRSHLKSCATLAKTDENIPPSLLDMQSRLEQFASQTILLATFLYSASPSASHAIKLSRLLVGLLEALNQGHSSQVDIRIFCRTARNNIVATMRKKGASKRVELHSLVLLDCLTYLGEPLSRTEFSELFLKSDSDELLDVDAIQILTLLRHCAEYDELKEYRQLLLGASRQIIDDKSDNRSTDAALLILNLLTCPFLLDEEKSSATGVSKSCVRRLRDSGVTWQFDWGADEHYYEKLRRKSAIAVY